MTYIPHPLCASFFTRLTRTLLLAWMAALLLTAPLVLAQSFAPLNDTFQAAATEFNLPRDLLVALGWVRSHLRPQVSEMGEVGLMQLTPAQIRQGAALLNESEVALQNDTGANIRGAAALLREAAERHYPGQAELAAAEWFEVVAAFSFPDNPAIGRGHAREIFALLGQGLVVTVEDELVEVTPWPEAAPLGATPEVAVSSDDYPPAHWVPAGEGNYAPAQRAAAEIDMIVIHTTEGSYQGVINWFSRPNIQVSGHYIIRSRDGDVTQMVRDHDIAWHAGHRATNSRSIGIEHEAFVNDATWYTDAMYQSSARLVRHLAQKYEIPLDRQHIIAHNEVPGCPNPGGGGGSCHTDPGPYWDWDKFMALVTAGLTETVPLPPVTYTGTVQLQGRSTHSGTHLYLADGSCASLAPTAAIITTPVATTTANGQFTLTLAETGGERCLVSHHPNYLPAQAPLSTPGDLGTVTLPAGDVNGDGRINILDLSLISLSYNSANSELDLSGDGFITIVDLALAAHNFGQKSPIEWASPVR